MGTRNGLRFESVAFLQYTMSKITALKSDLGFLINVGAIFSMAFGVLFYLQSNFVEAGEFKNYQVQEWEDKVYQLTIKENRLEAENKKLTPEEKAYLEMLKARLTKQK